MLPWPFDIDTARAIAAVASIAVYLWVVLTDKRNMRELP